MTEMNRGRGVLSGVADLEQCLKDEHEEDHVDTLICGGQKDSSGCQLEVVRKRRLRLIVRKDRRLLTSACVARALHPFEVSFYNALHPFEVSSL